MPEIRQDETPGALGVRKLSVSTSDFIFMQCKQTLNSWFDPLPTKLREEGSHFQRWQQSPMTSRRAQDYQWNSSSGNFPEQIFSALGILSVETKQPSFAFKLEKPRVVSAGVIKVSYFLLCNTSWAGQAFGTSLHAANEVFMLIFSQKRKL